MTTMERRLEASLAAMEQDGLRRRLPGWDHKGGVTIDRPGARPLISFASNDYLGLAKHPRVIEAAVRAATSLGAGSGASRLLGGGTPSHRLLEERLAAFKQTEAAIAFSTGYAAAVGLLTALASRDDIIILDKLSHASLVDGARLSGATIRVFPHNHLDRLEHLLKWARKSRPNAGIFVVTESIFSMDGDASPLEQIVELKGRYGAWLVLDEAHAVGVRGPEGRGLAHERGVAEKVDVHFGTLGKSLGAAGGFVAGSRVLIDYLINRARSLIFSTAPPAMVVAAGAEAVQILESKEGRDLQCQLAQYREQIFRRLSLPQNESAIFPVIIGDAFRAVKISEELLEEGLYIPAIRFPTVARNAARLRISLSAAHSPGDIACLEAALRKLTE